MGIKEEIDFVIEEEEKRNRRKTAVQSHRFGRHQIKPTYFAVLAAKLVMKYKQYFPDKPKEPAPLPGRRKKKITVWTIMKRDLRNVWHWINPPRKKKKIPGAEESWNDWEGQL